MTNIAFLNDIIKDTYYVVMKKKMNSNHDKLEILRRFLKMKYNITIGMESLKRRDKEYKEQSKG